MIIERFKSVHKDAIIYRDGQRVDAVKYTKVKGVATFVGSGWLDRTMVRVWDDVKGMWTVWSSESTLDRPAHAKKSTALRRAKRNVRRGVKLTLATPRKGITYTKLTASWPHHIPRPFNPARR